MESCTVRRPFLPTFWGGRAGEPPMTAGVLTFQCAPLILIGRPGIPGGTSEPSTLCNVIDAFECMKLFT